ncbi:hypothetical protein WJX81_007596 [Elliptochloris bilobata]|uniref:Uncharacterized protein n=1 Tax=Elliptochloris bilobata TaxID=381761 RepID=A0AAW1REQ0_9CHLO
MCSAEGPSDRSRGRVRNTAQEEYTFLESARVLMQEREAPSLVDRWDWHAWQLFVACLPPLAVLVLAAYARKDMRERELLLQSERERVWKAEDNAEAQRASKAAASQNQVLARLEALEAALAAVMAQGAPQSRGTLWSKHFAVA